MFKTMMLQVHNAADAGLRVRSVVCRAASVGTGNPVPDANKWAVLNGVLVGAGALPATAMAAGFLDVFVPPTYVPDV